MIRTPIRSEVLPPLLIVGGFYPLLTPMPLGRAARYFRRRGRAVWIVPHGFRSMRDIDRRAGLVAAEIRRILCRTGSDRLDILAYSMGGPAALRALQREDLAGRVRSFVSYGAPYRGSTASLAILLTGYFARMADQLLPGSEILEEIAAAGLPPGLHYDSAAGAKDWLCPPEQALLPGAEHVLCEHGHLDFLVNDSVYAFLEQHLR